MRYAISFLAIVFALGFFGIARATTGESFLEIVARLTAQNISEKIVGEEEVFGGLGGIKTTPVILRPTAVVPLSHNTYDLGAFDAAWKDIYVSGTIKGAGATFSGNLLPATNNTSDIGAYGTAWKDGYVSGTLTIGSNTTSTQIGSTGITTSGWILPTVNGSVGGLQFGAFGLAIGDIYTSGTLRGVNANFTGNTTLGDATNDTITFTGRLASSIIPGSNATRSIGQNGAAMLNFFSSGTIFMGSGGASSTISPNGNAFFSGNVSSSNITASALAGTGAGDVQVCYAAGGVFTQGATCGVSSAYYKEHIMPMKPEDALKKFMQLRAVTYDYKPDMGADDHKKENGFIAEEVAFIDPTLVVWAEPTPEHLKWTEENWPSLVRVRDGKTYVPNGVLYERVSVLQGAAFQAYIEKTDARLDKQESLLTKLFKLIEKVIAKLRM